MFIFIGCVIIIITIPRNGRLYGSKKGFQLYLNYTLYGWDTKAFRSFSRIYFKVIAKLSKNQINTRQSYQKELLSLGLIIPLKAHL